jgi:hypothetical protein
MKAGRGEDAMDVQKDGINKTTRKRGSRMLKPSNSAAIEYMGDNSVRNLRAGLFVATTIDFVIDYSISMTKILPTVYQFCSDLGNACKLGRGEVRYGVTFFADHADKMRWYDADFTTDLTKAQDGLLAGEIKRGSMNGYENIEEAVAFSLRKLSQVPAGERVMILVTDSTSDSKQKMDFRGKGTVRSAILFVPTEYSGPEYKFDLTDAQGISDRSKTPFIFDISEIMKSRYLKNADDSRADNAQTRNQLLQMLS